MYEYIDCFLLCKYGLSRNIVGMETKQEKLNGFISKLVLLSAQFTCAQSDVTKRSSLSTSARLSCTSFSRQGWVDVIEFFDY